MKNNYTITQLELLVVTFLCFSCSSCAVEQVTYVPLFKCTKKMDNPYGICSHISWKGERWEYDTREKDLSLIEKIGATWVRTDFDWTSLQKGMKGAFSFKHFDEMMTSVKNSNIQILGIISTPHNRNQYDEWDNYVEKTVCKYRNDITCWEIINEADIKFKYPIYSWFKADDYVVLLKKGYKIIKGKDKKKLVLFSGISDTDTEFVDTVFGAGVADCFDIMTVHRYSNQLAEPERLLYYFENLNLKLSKYNINKPVWLTECGTSTALGGAKEEIQAIKLPRIFLISFACGIDKVFWYKSRSCELNPFELNDNFGLWHKDYLPKPAFYTYQVLTKMCPDKSIRPTLERKKDVYIAQWKRPDKKRVYALWTSKTRRIVNLIAKGNYSCYDINGKTLYLGGSYIEVSPSILYFIGGQNFKLNISD